MFNLEIGMKKTLLLLCTLFITLGLYAQSVPFDQYGNVRLSDFESYADNQKVTITLKVSNAGSSVAPGWGIGTIKPINYSGDAKYSFSCQAVSAEGAENIYEFTIAELKSFAKVDGEYYVDQYSQKGLTITVYNGATRESIVVSGVQSTSSILDFESDAIDKTYPSISWSSSDISATVKEDPVGTFGKSLHVVASNYNAFPKLTVTLPDGKTLADIEKITFNIQFKDAGDASQYPQNKFKGVDYFFGAKGGSFTPNAPSGTVANLIGDEALDSWLNKEIILSSITNETLLALNAFDFALGISHNKCNYYLDNISFVSKTTDTDLIKKPDQSEIYPVAGGIQINGSGKVRIFSIDGRLIKQLKGDDQYIPLKKGLYIVTIDGNNTQKVSVK